MTEFSSISVERQHGAAIVTLDRPQQLNALDPTMLTELLTAIPQLAADHGLRTVVFTGRGRLFSAGVDLTTPFFMENVDDPSVYSGKRLLDWQHELILAIQGLPVPTLAAMNGHAVGGGGFGIAMACDLRYAVAGSDMWMVPGALDVVQDFGLSWLLQRVIGPSRTMHMALTGRRVSAQEAADWGLVNAVYDDQDVLRKAVDQFVEQLSGMGSDAVRMLKTVIRSGASSELRDQLQMEAIANGLAFQSEEFQAKKRMYLKGRGGSR